MLWDVSQIAGEGMSPLFKVEQSLHRWSAFAILPIFALANAGMGISADALSTRGASLVTLGAAVGLVVGKPLGIIAATGVAIRSGIAVLPPGVTMRHVTGVGLLCGVGFTVALFVAGLAFPTPGITEAAKVGRPGRIRHGSSCRVRRPSCPGPEADRGRCRDLRLEPKPRWVCPRRSTSTPGTNQHQQSEAPE